jgi:uncharacterized membrane protein HdeD (DUF308 family)
MTDPRIDPAGSPGPESGTSPQKSSGQRPSRHGLFHRSSRGKDSSGAGMSGSGASSTGASAAGTTTASRTSAAGATVPQQAGQAPSAPSARARYGEEYGEYGAGPAGRGETGADVIAKAANQSWLLLSLGALVMIGLGICLLVWPSASLTVVAVLIGAAVAVSGLIRLWEGFTARDQSGGMRAAYVVIGLLAVFVGLYLLRHHTLTLFIVAFVTGVYFVAHGFADIGVALSVKAPGRVLRGILGLFSIAAGLVLVVWPGISLLLLLTIMGAWLLFYGVVVGAMAFSLRRSAKAVTKLSATSTTAMPAGAA